VFSCDQNYSISMSTYLRMNILTTVRGGRKLLVRFHLFTVFTMNVVKRFNTECEITYNNLCFIFSIFFYVAYLCESPYRVVTLTKFWIFGTHNVCMYVCMYVCTCVYRYIDGYTRRISCFPSDLIKGQIINLIAKESLYTFI